MENVLAAALGLPKGHARVIVGRTSTRKLVEIEGLSESEIRRRLAENSG